jgi:hypothetical protein
MKKIWHKNWYSILIILILAITSYLRFYNFSQRWMIAFDQARDAVVGRYAAQSRMIPLIGPLSSGASVVGGPQWYWIIAFFTRLYPKSILSPWVGLALMYIFFVFMMIKIGEEIGGRKLALITGILAAFSPLQISQGVSLTNQSPMSVISGLSVWSMIRYLKTKKPVFAFILGGTIALGFNIHMQGIGLFFLVPAVLIFGGKPKLKDSFWFVIGFVLQFIPMIIFETRTKFFNTRGFIDYYLYSQYQRWMPNRWLTYVFSFWPDLWRKIAGGSFVSTYLIGLGLGGWLTIDFWKKKLPKYFQAVILSFILIFILLRYYRGPSFESYYVFVHPFVLLLAAWLVWKVFSNKIIIGLILLVYLLYGSNQENIAHYRVEKNGTYPLVKTWEQELLKKFPGKKFALHDYYFHSQDKTVSLVLLLMVDGLIDDQGVKIGVSIDSRVNSKKIFYTDSRHYLSDISGLKVEGDMWAFLNPSEIWKDKEEWYYKVK